MYLDQNAASSNSSYFCCNCVLKDGGGFRLNLLLEALEPMTTFTCLEGKRLEFNVNL